MNIPSLVDMFSFILHKQLCMGVLATGYKKPPDLVPVWLCHFTLPSTTLYQVCHLALDWWSQSLYSHSGVVGGGWAQWHLLVILICISLIKNDIEYFFMCFLDILVYILFDSLNLLPIFNSCVCLSVVKLSQFFVDPGKQSFVKYRFCRCFLQGCNLPVYFLNGVF